MEGISLHKISFMEKIGKTIRMTGNVICYSSFMQNPQAGCQKSPFSFKPKNSLKVFNFSGYISGFLQANSFN